MLVRIFKTHLRMSENTSELILKYNPIMLTSRIYHTWKLTYSSYHFSLLVSEIPQKHRGVRSRTTKNTINKTWRQVKLLTIKGGCQRQWGANGGRGVKKGCRWSQILGKASRGRFSEGKGRALRGKTIIPCLQWQDWGVRTAPPPHRERLEFWVWFCFPCLRDFC